MKIAKLGLISLLASAALYAGTYKVDQSHSHVGFKVKHMMISNVAGEFNEFDGTIEYDEATKTLKDIKGTVKVSSIDTDNEKRDGHLKSADLFDAAKYPEITFDLTKVDGDKAYGNLTMHGVTKEVEFEVENNGVIKDPWGNQRVGLELEAKINRIDYGIKWNKALETGGVVVGEEVKLDIVLEGILNK